MVAVGGLAVVAWLLFTLPEVGDRADALHRAEPGQPAAFVVADDIVEWEIFIEPSGRSQSGVRYEIRDENDEIVPVGRAEDSSSFFGSSGSSYEWFGRSGRSIASVRLPAGSYRLLVVESDATIAIGEDPTEVLGRAVGGAAALGLPFILGGAALAVVSAIRDTRRRTIEAEPPPPSSWSSGEWPAERGR